MRRLRRHFNVDAESVVEAALAELAGDAKIKQSVVRDAVSPLQARRARLQPIRHLSGR